MTLPNLLALVDRVAAGIGPDPAGSDRFAALVETLGPYILGSPRLLREAVVRAWESGLVSHVSLGDAAARYVEDECEVDAAMAADEP